MGTHVNPGNDGFRKVLKAGRYVDKTGLISYINSVLGTEKCETAFTRPRRFGKTTACKMLTAYYSVGADSKKLFKGMQIEHDSTFSEHLNRHPVISFDLLAFKDDWKKIKPPKGEEKPTLAQYIEKTLVYELEKEYPEADIGESAFNFEPSLPKAMLNVSKFLEEKMKKEGKALDQEDAVLETNFHKFIVIIDEWDLVLREEKDSPQTVDDYIEFLRSLFRSQDTDFYLAGAYMTGILPIIRYNTESALSDFKEHTMLMPLMLSEYVGFTKEDVRKVCQRFGADEELMKTWYDGYDLPGVGEVYCPSSVMEAAVNDIYAGYWTKTSAMESLTAYIYADLDGLRDAMNSLLDGNSVPVNPLTFQNRLDQVNTRDKVLTVLVHLGYLAYDYKASTVRIPNLEVRQQMLNAFSEAPNEGFFNRIRRCEKALKAVKDMDSQAVADVLKEIHDERPPIHYNDEQALRYVVIQAFNNSPNAMFDDFEELSSGQGFVDILFKPLKRSAEIPMLVELKYGESTNKAINQIHEKDYIAFLRKLEYRGDVLLVGINYSKNTKDHTCRIEKIRI